MDHSEYPRRAENLPLLLRSTRDASVPTPSSSKTPQTMERSATPDLKFVTFSHPDDLRRRRDVRTDIRRHVMKKIGEQRRRPKTRAQGEPSSSAPMGTSMIREGQQGMPTRTSTNVSGAVDPPSMMLPMLWDFPVEASGRVVELIRFLNEQRSVYLPFRNIWFDIALTDKGAFHVTLGNAADLLLRMQGGSDPETNPEMLQYYSLSVTHLRERLDSAVDSVSDGMVAHVLSHLCLCMRRQDWTAWKAHMDGLAAIAGLRGGLAHLSRGVHTWILLSDLGGSIVHDTVPRLPLPTYLPLPCKTSPKSLPTRLQKYLSYLCPDSIATTQTIEALEKVFFIANNINTEGNSPFFWHRDQDGMNLLGPCIHYLLSMSRLPEHPDATPGLDELIAEMVRLISLCIMSRLKSVFSFNAPEQTELESKFAKFTTSYAKHLDGPYRDLKI
ncbi:hypothetical protein NLU13_9091 [Sarocladium strictum]|uniref:Uncharacterized protein n=1 Tax=Sarocladium strictum TaxID=5046 RepID=A0AA39L3V2_SARSR|nr:hypothetical protein NLU13_9091 [Sarocladium strictum]